MKVRGARSLFADIFYTDETPVATLPPKKGRNSEKDAQRNECLIDRYYYTGSTEKTNYFELISSIADQFFISATTAHNVIQANKSRIMQLRTLKPTKKYFQDKWPHLVW